MKKFVLIAAAASLVVVGTVRVELVAKNSIAGQTDEPIALPLAGSEPGFKVPDANQKAPQTELPQPVRATPNALAARKAYETAIADRSSALTSGGITEPQRVVALHRLVFDAAVEAYKQGVVKPEEVATSSQQLVASELRADPKRYATIAFEHLKRVEQLAKVTPTDPNAFVGPERRKRAAMDFHVAQVNQLVAITERLQLLALGSYWSVKYESKIPKVVVDDPGVVEAKPTAPNEIEFQGKKVGVTRAQVFNEGGGKNDFDLVVYRDDQDLGHSIASMVPPFVNPANAADANPRTQVPDPPLDADEHRRASSPATPAPSGVHASNDYRAIAEAAGKTYQSLARAFEDDTVTLDLLCNWSQKWRDAERKAAKTSKDDIAAMEAYLARMQKIHDTIKKLFDAGARGGEAEKYYGMVFYVEEAKEMLKAARAQAAKESADLRPTIVTIPAGVAVQDRPDRPRIGPPTAPRDGMHSTTFGYAASGAAAKRQSLKFDGRTFDEWREELLTELKPERRADAIRAFNAFAVNGYGRDAAQAIVDVMRGHDVWMIDGSPEGKLKQTALDAFRTIERADAIPVLLEALKSGNANQRQFAAHVLWSALTPAKEAEAALTKAVGDPDFKVRHAAINALAQIQPLPEAAVRPLIAAVGDADAQVRRVAISLLASLDQRPEGLVPALRKSLKDSDPNVVLVAIFALVPQAANAGSMMMGGGFGGMEGMAPGMGMNMGDRFSGRMGGMGRGMSPGGAFGSGGGRFGDMKGGAMPGPMGPPGANLGGRGVGGGLGGEAPPSAPTGPEPIYVPEFLELLGHANEQVRSVVQSAIYALGPKCKPALPTALDWLRKDDAERRFIAYSLLYNIGAGAKEAVPELMRIIEDPKRDGEQIVSAMEALGAIGVTDAEAITKIEKVVERLPPEGKVGFETQIWRQRAQQTLDRIRKPAESSKPRKPEDPNASSTPKAGAPSPQTVTARLQVKSMIPGYANPAPFEVNSFRQTQIQLIKGPNVLRLALREPGIAQLPVVMAQPDAVKWLESQLKLSYPGDSEILEVSMSGDQPEELVKLVNAVVDVYFKVHVLEAIANRKRDKDKLQQTYNDLEAKIATLRKKINRPMGDFEERAAAAQISNLTSELAKLRQEQANLSRLKTEAELTVMQAATMLAVEKDPSRKQALIEREISKDPRLMKMQEEYDAISQELKNETSKSTTPTKLDVTKAAVEKYQKLLEENAQAIDQRRKNLEAIKIDSAELDQLREGVKQHEALRAKMFQDLERKKLEAEAPSRVELIERATSSSDETHRPADTQKPPAP